MNWTCPYCNRPQIFSASNTDFAEQSVYLNGDGKAPTFIVRELFIRCLNDSCKKITFTVELYSYNQSAVGKDRKGKRLQSWPLMPTSSAKPQPEYIPKPIREDYVEACLVRDLSPKASATLARRCLQGMIRDFTGVVKDRLIDEIKALRKQVEAGTAAAGVNLESVEAIDNVRDIGNIGAHMEKDINLVIDVEPGEAQMLISLIELLFEEWYIARHVRQERLHGIRELAASKKAAKALPKPASAVPLPAADDKAE